jgi:hypothetical protein
MDNSIERQIEFSAVLIEQAKTIAGIFKYKGADEFAVFQIFDYSAV